MLHKPGVRIILHGDKEACRDKIAAAFSLFNSIGANVFGGIDVWRAERNFHEWRVDFLRANENAFINIYIAKIAEKSKKREKGRRECFCSAHFSFGVILARKVVSHTEYTDTEQPADKQLYWGRCAYIVAICTGTSYKVVEDVYDSNYGFYFVGQYVLVSIFREMSTWENPLDCGRTCLMQEPAFTMLSISPVILRDFEMNEWQTVISE